MTVRILTCAALLLTACGGAQPAKEEAKAPETRTEVKHGTEIALANPDLKAGMTINEALANRASSRDYTPAPLSLEELSGVMWAAAGVNRADGRLTAPSALALYPVRVYAVFAEGIYSYDAKAQKLVRVVEGDHRKLAGLQDFVYTAPLNLVYIADRTVYDDKKNIPAEAVRYLCGQDAAGYAENVNLYTAGHGMKSITRGGAREAELLQVLGLDAKRYFLALAQTVGK
ncbi:nitroreductase family protein [uncultured Alistipes sp.]|jgi:nitroreductase family|uniref:nitroreductase family protein n=1 Tax=uncultured Alistipes sp. TaxID=538949 RepID=UPI0025CF161E|nr:nitroreductase family protein [uncultured Alistipes sp.]